MDHSTLLITLALLGLALMTQLKLALSRRHHRSLPGPKGWPIIGNAPDLATSPNLVPLFRRWAQEYGSLMQFSVFGTNHVVISKERHAVELLVKRAPHYDDRGTPYAMRRFTQDLNPALMDKSDAWRRERKLLHSLISITATKKYTGLIADESTLTLNRLLEDPSSYRNYFKGYCYSVLTRIMLGFSVPDGLDPFVVKYEKMIDDGIQFFRPDKYPSNLFPFLGRLPTWAVPSNGKIDRQRSEFTALNVQLRQDVATAMSNNTAKDGAMKHFLENRADFDVSDEEADYAFSSLMGGGTRSPFNGLLGILYLLMVHPEWQQRLQHAIDEVVGPNRLPTIEDIPQLPVVRAVVKESIRFRSIVAELGIPRQLRRGKNDSYAGFFFKSGTTFHTNFGQILMDKEMYPDQQEFNPARWLDPAFPTYREPLTVHPNCQNFSPFGYGRRACPGYHIAEMTMVIMVARLAWGCTIRRPVDPVTKEPVQLKIEFEGVPNPGPLPFPCEIEPRGGDRMKVVQAAAEKVQ